VVTTLERARDICAGVADPELPLLTIGDLGIVRDVRLAGDGGVEVVLTPTYSGCPATEVIQDDVRRALAAAGFAEVTVRTALRPAWTTDWITDAGRRKLEQGGIAVPPRPAAAAGAASVDLGVRCPRCGSVETVLVSRFGATACQAMHRCTACLEPFDSVKPF
jgi:ring-1,2-phenylacetyl-CoA epoxidase subunit PaaD